MYCVRCGDLIEKDELICDKCGLRFTVVNNDGSTVYINQSPIKPATPMETVQHNVKAKPEKKKKFRFGWIIALASVAVFLFICFAGIAALGSGILLGILLFSDDSEPVVVSNPTEVNSPGNVPAVTYENPNQEDQSEYFSNVIREPFTEIKGDGTDTVTVMIYMNGSDLESQYGCATSDLKEMLNATLSDNVNVVIQTGGTKKWKTDGISNKHSQRFLVNNGQLELIDDSLGQLDITDENTLKDFIVFCRDNYPANRNILIFWNHGGGVVYGYGVDENLNDAYAALTLDEIQRATKDAGVKFEMIGFDACLMGGLETACVLCDVADYLVVSEDFEPGEGWEYQNWLSLLGYNSSTSMTDVGKVIVDDFVRESMSQDSEGILALIDLRYTRLLYSTWTEFAYSNETDLLAHDYSMEMHRSDRAMEKMFKDVNRDIWDWISDDYTMETYCYAVDIMALASTMDTEESKALETVLKSAVLYCSSTAGDSYLTGLSVTLPYGDNEFFSELEGIFNKCGFDSKYITFLEKFVDAGYSGSYDWENSDFNGWDSYYDDSYYYDWNDYDWNDYDWDSFYDSEYDWDDYNYDWYDYYYNDDLWYFDDTGSGYYY